MDSSDFQDHRHSAELTPKIDLYSEWVSQVQDHLKDTFRFSTLERLSTNYTRNRLSALFLVFRTAFIQTRRSISHSWVVSQRFFTSQVKRFSTPESLRDKNLPHQELQDNDPLFKVMAWSQTPCTPVLCEIIFTFQNCLRSFTDWKHT